jgi:hypothetical protein
MSGTVWAVSNGEYSDYSVGWVFSTKEGAEAFATRMNGPDYLSRYSPYFVEELPLDPPLPEVGPYYLASCSKHGSVRFRYEANEECKTTLPEPRFWQSHGSWEAAGWTEQEAEAALARYITSRDEWPAPPPPPPQLYYVPELRAWGYTTPDGAKVAEVEAAGEQVLEADATAAAQFQKELEATDETR